MVEGRGAPVQRGYVGLQEIKASLLRRQLRSDTLAVRLDFGDPLLELAHAAFLMTLRGALALAFAFALEAAIPTSVSNDTPSIARALAPATTLGQCCGAMLFLWFII